MPLTPKCLAAVPIRLPYKPCKPRLKPCFPFYRRAPLFRFHQHLHHAVAFLRLPFWLSTWAKATPDLLPCHLLPAHPPILPVSLDVSLSQLLSLSLLQHLTQACWFPPNLFLTSAHPLHFYFSCYCLRSDVYYLSPAVAQWHPNISAPSHQPSRAQVTLQNDARTTLIKANSRDLAFSPKPCVERIETRSRPNSLVWHPGLLPIRLQQLALPPLQTLLPTSRSGLMRQPDRWDQNDCMSFSLSLLLGGQS